jgi:hypothetical protein
MDAVNKSAKQRGRPFRPGESGNPRGRPFGSLNKRTRTLLEAAEAGGEMPLDFLLRLMRDTKAPLPRRIEAAKAAAPFLHPKLTAIDAKLSPTTSEPAPEKLLVEFVVPSQGHTREELKDPAQPRGNHVVHNGDA